MDIEDLKEKLSQVNESLKITPEGVEFDSLMSLKSDLQELIDLTNQSNDNSDQVDSEKDALADEYARFMDEMTKSGAYDVRSAEEEKTELQSVITNELTSLEGTHCGVLFSHKWGGAPSLYNAMVCSIIKDNLNSHLTYDNIQVRVMFTNPTSIEMVPCPYYLEGECKFDEDDCRFSHGEIVPFSSLKVAVQPNFENLKQGSRVLAKIKKNDDDESSSKRQSERYLLWHRALIKSIDLENHTCEIKLETGVENNYTVEFGDVFPLTDEYLDTDSDSDGSSSPRSIENLPGTSKDQCIIEKSMLSNPGSVKLGDWEKHTRGIGSKLMVKMGYVIGNGLGPLGEGRVQPVPYRMTPNGLSLDHCMDLKDSEDPIKVEKRLRRLEKKKEEREKRTYERLKNRKENSVFNFLNNTLSGHSSRDSDNKNSSADQSKNKNSVDMKSSSCKSLNIEQFKLAESINRTEKDIAKLKDSMKRNIKDSSVHNGLSVQLMSKLEEVEKLKKMQSNISKEQTSRKDQRKLTIF
ncbi:zinc finger CCCH-type with G patch domain-containing protein isoform X2 [Arctopsyche grandis]|uniref:zinc finger CCCH-type with G patch domain-containing protein isoform X2 n=1 Tax=Arctopsyche grandis TaxID=121162 RepID=UPI00406D9A59